MTSILANGQAAGTVGMIVWLVVLFAVMYFLYDPSTEEGAEEKGAYA